MKLTVDAQVEAILARVASGDGRERLVRLALRLACQDIRGPEVPVDDLVLGYLRDAEAALAEQEGEGPGGPSNGA